MLTKSLIILELEWYKKNNKTRGRFGFLENDEVMINRNGTSPYEIYHLKVMLKKIKRIRNLGLVFPDFNWDTNLPDFKNFNLIYGWTGSGKTTLSRLFAVLETGSLEKYPNLEYEIETLTGNYKQGEQLDKKIRVFNEDYISKNVGLLEGKANPIFILGEENQKLLEEIKKDEELLELKRRSRKAASENKDRAESARAKQFTDIARIISSNASGEATRKYDKREAEAAFSKLKSKAILEETKIQEYSLTLKQLEKPLISELEIKKIKDEQSSKEESFSDIVNEIVQEGKELSRKTVESVIIDRLKIYPDISNWVETGLVIHKIHQSQKCEFCGQQLPQSQIKELAQHFSEADKKLKEDIDTLVIRLSSVYSLIKNTNTIDKANFYEELQKAYQKEAQTFEKEKKTILEKIEKFEDLLKGKKAKTTESIVLDEIIDTQPVILSIEELNIEIRKHNQKTNNFKTEKDIAQKELEVHYLSSVYDEVKQLEQKINDFGNEISGLDNGNPAIVGDVSLSDLADRIVKNRSKISSPNRACAEINRKLEVFLDRKEIVFEVNGEGYSIKRNGEVANYLSEGEKTAIAFVYFVVHLRDQNFDIKDGVVVIDDPISSLDSNSLFQAFAFLKNAAKEASQVFIFTHNFDFLRLLLDWLSHSKLRSKSGFYMIKNEFLGNRRVANICQLDKDLQDHESEYHYLFKLLYTFKSDGTIANAYSMPNIARKFLETFLMFRVPNSKNHYEKIESLKEFDQDKRTAIYKFTNDQSHITGKGFDPSLVPETQKNVTYLLEMVKTTFPEHYKILEEPFIGSTQPLT